MKQKLKKLIGAAPASESGFKKRMRFHQGWWRAFVLAEEEGERPLDSRRTVCNTIRNGEQSKKNFLTDNTRKVVEHTLGIIVSDDKYHISDKVEVEVAL